MNTDADLADIDRYIAAASAEARPILCEIRRIVMLAVPQAEETLSYRMPAFRLKRTFFYFAAFNHHVGIYPPVTQDPDLVEELRPFANQKGNLGFPLDQPMPYDLIARVAIALAKQSSDPVPRQRRATALRATLVGTSRSP